MDAAWIETPGHLYVRKSNGHVFVISYDSAATIAQVKRMIKSKEHIPISRQRLIYPRTGKQLEDHHTLGEYGIPGSSFLALMP